MDKVILTELARVLNDSDKFFGWFYESNNRLYRTNVIADKLHSVEVDAQKLITDIIKQGLS